MSEASIRVFVLDEHELVRRGLIDLLAAAPDMLVVGAAGTAEDALPLIAASKPRVVLLDAQQSHDGGIDVGRQVRARNPEVCCVLLTSFDDDKTLFTAVMAGAAGYLVKQVGGTALLDGIRSVAAGRPLLDAGVTERLLDRLRLAGQGEHRGSSLDEREQQVLELISRGSTDAQIAEKLDVGESTVRDQVATIYGKLALRGRGGSRPAEPGAG